MTTIFDYFPSKYNPRKQQLEVLNHIDSAINSGYSNIIVNAPTGVGKSYIAITMAIYYGYSNIVTATKTLQDQYAKEFPILHVFKGRDNFPCLFNTKLTCGDVPSSLCNGKDVALGTCRYKPHKKLYIKNPIQIRDPYSEEIIKYPEKGTICEYYDQKYKALLAFHTLYNYHSYFTLLLRTRELPVKPLTIYDEAHNIENILIDFLGLTISRDRTPEKIKLPKKDDIDSWLSTIEELIVYYDNIVDTSNNDREVAKAERRLEKLKFVHENILYKRDDYIVDIIFDNEGIRKGVIKPLYCNRYVNVSVSKVNIFMSATLLPSSLDYILKNKEDIYYIEVDSPFDASNRRVELLNIEKLNYNTFNDINVLRKLAKTIDNLLNKHNNERGLILTTSYRSMHTIYDLLNDRSRSRIKTIYNNNEIGSEEEKIDFNELLIEHMKNHNTVIFSASHWEGVDLKDDLCRFIIIVKAPYPDLSDKRTRIITERNRKWYELQAITKLIQGCGRGVRNENDYCITYVLDSSVQLLLYRNMKNIPKWFKNSIRRTII